MISACGVKVWSILPLSAPPNINALLAFVMLIFTSFSKVCSILPSCFVYFHLYLEIKDIPELPPIPTLQILSQNEEISLATVKDFISFSMTTKYEAIREEEESNQELLGHIADRNRTTRNLQHEFASVFYSHQVRFVLRSLQNSNLWAQYLRQMSAGLDHSMCVFHVWTLLSPSLPHGRTPLQRVLVADWRHPSTQTGSETDRPSFFLCLLSAFNFWSLSRFRR